MKSVRFIMGVWFVLFASMTALALVGACSGGDGDDDDSGGEADDEATVDDDAGEDDDAATDDDHWDDDVADDAADDVTDDAADDASDDTGGPPSWPSNHSDTWDCYICHETDFNGAPGEPHGHSFTAPTDCAGCHSAGDWVNSPSGPTAPNGHDAGMNCTQCHSVQHGKTWQEAAQCKVCHSVGSAGAAPNYASNHDASWNCYLCHAQAFNGSPKEPHGHFYTAPADCLLCHHAGSFVHNPTEGGMLPGSNCLSCHQGQHGKTWQDKSQCLFCHNPNAGDDDN